MPPSERPDITNEQISEILDRKYPKSNYEIVSKSTEPLKERSGFMGDHAVLKLKVLLQSEGKNKEHDLKFFVKFFPLSPSVAEFARSVGAFDKEVFIYDLFGRIHNKIALLKQCVPQCYYKNPEEFLVMDNLIDNGYQTLNKHETLDYDAVIVTLSSLSKLHASSLIYEEQLSDELGEPYRLNEHYNFVESLFQDGEAMVSKIENDAAIVGILNCIEIFKFPQKLASGKLFRDVLKQACYRIYDLVKPSTTYRNVVSHGDCWATNFLIKYDNDRPVNCKFVDFQCGRYVPPAQDVLALLYLTTSREFRSKHMYHLIGYYYNCLEKNLACYGRDLKKILSFNEFFDSCKEQKLFGLVQTAIYLPLILLSGDDVMKYFADEAVYKRCFLEDRSVLVVEHMDKDESFKKRIFDSIHDLKDYCDYL